MIYALIGLIAFLASAVVAVSVGVLISFGKEAERLHARDRAQFRVLTARLVTDELGPGAELRALLKLQRDDAAAIGLVDPFVGRETVDDEMIERRSRRTNRDISDGLIDQTGNPIQPTGST